MKTRIVTLLLLLPLISYSQDATEIIKRVDAKMRGNSSSSTMTMKIIRPDWTREITMEGWSLGTTYSLILIKSPARDAGTAFLKREKEIWNWQPTIDRVVKLPPSMMSQSWMGSDFTNDDLVKESSVVYDYNHFIRGDTTINGYDSWKIEMIPKEDAAVVWGRIMIYVAKQDDIELLIRYYDEDNYLINTMVLSEIREMDGRVIPTRMDMIPAENPDQRTVIIYQEMEFNIDLSESYFSIQNMKRMR
ncbi:outer membrane lipoprotein-sorting protein [Fulvivirga sedimenti]|uniref:Outer membrane lipoprotein-sorting protein n=1 Tax=Fulvivirga sedimenti TaxID=2879465 RepID=A0A9X1HU79_9BACT|nr:outer membrane lipoprotein-sorting protein [Fulvivirga sedimenti]MCA6075075.1 outer membrane lipoprotein-sorting protein [Fulvivirga sedimenti]MCA6076252.1 outer membrane lipoprotein-sorting protein [Fulvivirga sedimenti]MCA6077380.1 outer membrane lipoprotein-sorting protein [Fulvivirga sedimenti]